MLTADHLALIAARNKNSVYVAARGGAAPIDVQGDIDALLAEIAELTMLMADREADLQFEYDRANAAEAEVERAHQFLDECAIGGNGTEPLVERIGVALRSAV